MQINAHEASRIRKADKCSLVFSRTNEFTGLVLSVIKRKDFSEQFIKYSKTAGIWEGKKFVIIAYFSS